MMMTRIPFALNVMMMIMIMMMVMIMMVMMMMMMMNYLSSLAKASSVGAKTVKCPVGSSNIGSRPGFKCVIDLI